MRGTEQPLVSRTWKGGTFMTKQGCLRLTVTGPRSKVGGNDLQLDKGGSIDTRGAPE
jgi:hypothetical protein